MKGRNKNKQGRKAQIPSVQRANATAKPAKTQPVQLELPEGYKPKSKPGTKKRRNNKGAKAHIGTAFISRTQLDNIDNMAGGHPLAGKGDTKLEAPQERRLGVVPLFPGDVLPSMAKFFKVEGRDWKSLGTRSNAKQFLQSYDEFQRRKYDPEVFAVEKADPAGLMMGTAFQAEDLAKYQALRTMYYVDEGRVDKLEALKNNINWPNQFGIMTKAPFVRTSPTEHHYKEDMSNRLLPIFKAMGVHEIAQKIISHMPTFVPMARLSQTCHHAFNVVAINTERWDMTAADFLGDDKENRLGNYCRLPLIVGPVRNDMLVTEEKRPYDTTYTDEFDATVKLFKALNHRATMIASLQLHRLSFLDVAGVDCILASLPNLENLGVYQCPLLHFGRTKDLLDSVKSHPKDGGPRMYVNLDFFPMYHQGPNNMARHGSYGVSWNSLGCDTASAILQVVLYELYPAARELGIDLLSWDSSFRFFLEKCPMPKWAVVKLYEAIRTFECAQGRRAVADINKYDPNLECWKDFANEVAAAVIGDEFDPFIVNTSADKRLEEYTRATSAVSITYRREDFWWHRQELCTTCDKPILWTFVAFAEGFCWGCILKQYLNAQVDHHKTAKAKAAAAWLGGRQRLSVKQRKVLEPSQYEHDARDQTVRLSDAKCLQDALMDRRIEAGLIFANVADGIRDFEMHKEHTLDINLAGDPDALSLERRHAKFHERHGPIDRKFNDRQYRPVGWFNIAVSNVFLPQDYAYIASSLKFGEWREQLELKFPNLTREQITQKVNDFWGQHVETSKDYYERQRESRIHCDTRSVRGRFGQLVKRRGTPNRNQMEWDAMISQMLVNKYPHYIPAKKGPKFDW